MANPDRLSGLDASFLSLERNGAHMHVGSVLVFDGDAPPYEEFVAKLEQRLHLVPRYRQKLAWPPLVQSRPVWIDDPHFNARYHVRHTALPGAGRRGGAAPPRRAGSSPRAWTAPSRCGSCGWSTASATTPSRLISKTHHALVDGVSGVDISTVLFDLEPEPPEPDPAPALVPAPGAQPRPTCWPRRSPSGPPRRWAWSRGALDAARHPERAVGGGGRAVKGLAAMAAAGMAGAPPSPLNVRIGSHRRFAWVDADLERFKAIKTALRRHGQRRRPGRVAGALRAFMIRRGRDTEGMELKAMVPVSVRADAERGALGNRVAAMYAPLPIYAGGRQGALRVSSTPRWAA